MPSQEALTAVSELVDDDAASPQHTQQLFWVDKQLKAYNKMQIDLQNCCYW